MLAFLMSAGIALRPPHKILLRLERQQLLGFDQILCPQRLKQRFFGIGAGGFGIATALDR